MSGAWLWSLFHSCLKNKMKNKKLCCSKRSLIWKPNLDWHKNAIMGSKQDNRREKIFIPPLYLNVAFPTMPCSRTNLGLLLCFCICMGSVSFTALPQGGTAYTQQWRPAGSRLEDHVEMVGAICFHLRYGCWWWVSACVCVCVCGGGAACYCCFPPSMRDALGLTRVWRIKMNA